jgi:hypothetical protein
MLNYANALLLPLLAGSLSMAQGIDDDVVRDIDVAVERLNGTTGLNGVRLRMERATGTAVGTLAERMIRAWEKESGAPAVHLQKQSGWMVASRLHRGESQVIQWRGARDEGELIWSSAELHQPPQAPRMRVPLAAGCRGSAPVHGVTGRMHFIQLSASCAQSPSALLTALAESLRRKGWQLTSTGQWMLHAVTGDVHVQITAMPALRDLVALPGHRSTLVMVETRPARTP